MKKFVLVNLLFLVWQIPFIGFASGPGTSGARVLTQSIGARQLGLADSFTGLADDINALFFNPAGLGFFTGNEFSSMYIKDILDLSYGSLSYGSSSGLEGVWGINILGFQGGDIEIFSPDGQSRVTRAQEDYLGTVGLAMKSLENLGVGINLKVLQTTLVNEYKAQSYMVDLGWLLRQSNGFSLGFCLQNLGKGIKYKNKTDLLPLTARVGVAYKPLKISNFTMLVDLIKQRDDKIRGTIGIEYWVLGMLALRTGYKVNYDLDGFTAGVGLKVKQLQFDYGIGTLGDFGGTQRVSISIKW